MPIIALNKFKEGEFECDDPTVLEVLSYYRITRKNYYSIDGRVDIIV